MQKGYPKTAHSRKLYVIAIERFTCYYLVDSCVKLEEVGKNFWNIEDKIQNLFYLAYTFLQVTFCELFGKKTWN